jgi:hypothetical protein
MDAAPLPELGFYGLPGHTHSPVDLLSDFAGLLRRLWKGEAILGHDGPGR